jgi:hypothetical protein
VRRPLLFFFWLGKKEEKRRRIFVKIRKKSAQKSNRARVRTYTEKKPIFSLSSAARVIYTKTVLSLSLFSAERGARDTSTFLSLNLHRAARVLRKTRVFIKAFI